jgi:hypothetical protein
MTCCGAVELTALSRDDMGDVPDMIRAGITGHYRGNLLVSTGGNHDNARKLMFVYYGTSGPILKGLEQWGFKPVTTFLNPNTMRNVTMMVLNLSEEEKDEQNEHGTKHRAHGDGGLATAA